MLGRNRQIILYNLLIIPVHHVTEGNIVTFLWFCRSVLALSFELLNTILINPLISSLNLEDRLPITRE